MTTVKVFLDDERRPPPGWRLVRWPSEALALLESGEVTHLSLDHDLGDDERGTGYDVVVWIEEAVATTDFVPPEITVHSANTSARAKMEAGVAAIARLFDRRSTEARPPAPLPPPKTREVKTKAALLAEIEEAFDGVVLGAGVSLHQTKAIDDYAGEEEEQRIRSADEQADWRKLLLDPDLGRFGWVGGPAFTDAEGMRFHLPAYLSLALRDFDAAEAEPALASWMNALTEPEDERLRLLDAPQRRCVGHVLTYLSKEYELESEELDEAIEEWLRDSR